MNIDFQKKCQKNPSQKNSPKTKPTKTIIIQKRFLWTKTKLEKCNQVKALTGNLCELEGSFKSHSTTHNRLVTVRKQVTKKIARQQKEGLHWKNVREDMNKYLSILEHCYEYISNPSYNLWLPAVAGGDKSVES